MIYIYILITLIASAFFSGSEIAYVSADKLRLELDRNKGGLVSSILSFLYRSPNRFITTMLLGNNVALVIYGILMASLLEPVLLRWTDNDIIILILQSLLSTLIILFTGEFIPKVIFRINANLMMQLLALPLMLAYIILFPFMWLISQLTQGILLIAGRRGDEAIPHTFSPLDLEHYLESNHDESKGSEVESEVKFIQNAISFPTLQVRDCMTPRNEIVSVALDDEKSTLEEKFLKTGRSKLIVYKDNIDEPIGYIHSSEMFANKDWHDSIVPAVFVPESMFANKLMRLLMQKKKSIAIVIDELGGTAGMVTLEDVIEEIFGNIEDEHDRERRVSKQLDDKTFIFSGRMEIDDINEHFDLKLPEADDFQTIAGFILHHHQSIPAPNEVIEIEGFRFEILRSSSTKIILVKLHII